jgi:lycopene beta-cyclase
MTAAVSPSAGTKNHHYDYIIAGAGCAGLSLLVHMIESGKFADKKILLVDKEKKSKNDRTWSFWETKPGLFEKIVCKQWPQIWFHSKKMSKLFDIAPYTYKMIRGIDFYNYCFEKIEPRQNINIAYGNVEEIKSDSETFIKLDGQKITAQYIFNSILFEKPQLKKNEYYLLQHFKAWIIETPKPIFNREIATLMDFRVHQQYGTAFVYVMPFSETKAMVEYTLFTQDLLQPQQYDDELKIYINQFLQTDSYTITDEEFGIIPMTNYKFPVYTNNIVNIGTAGGQTKASSGYTFRFIQKHAAAITAQLIKNNSPVINVSSKRFGFYDSVLLNILNNNKLPCDEIFTDLFKKNKPQQVLRFLDNETSLAEELKIFSTLPTIPFLKSAIKQL